MTFPQWFDTIINLILILKTDDCSVENIPCYGFNSFVWGKNNINCSQWIENFPYKKTNMITISQVH